MNNLSVKSVCLFSRKKNVDENKYIEMNVNIFQFFKSLL